MIRKFFYFIFLPIFLTTTGEFVLKHYINLSVAGGGFTYVVPGLGLVLNPGIFLSVAAIIVGGALWVVAMSKFELSFLYPFLSINYIVIIVGSQFLLHEEVSLFRYLSIVLIIIGLVFISRSPHSEKGDY